MGDLEEIRKRKIEELRKKLSKKPESKAVNSPIHVTDETFDSTIKNHPTVVVDCWAEWCGPCHIIAPTVEALAKDYSGKIVFGKLNVDEGRRTAIKYGVMSIPTLLIFKGGKLVDRIVGAVPRQQIEQKLKNLVG